jgi:ferredoxin
MTVERRREKIVGLLRKDARSIEQAERIDHCRKGSCDRCGDLCPVKASKWADENITKLVDLLASSGSEPVLQLRYTRESWSRRSGELGLPGLSLYEKQERRAKLEPIFTSLDAVVKALRRAFDELNEPNVAAIGMIDAWYGFESWKIGGSLIVAGIAKSALCDAFPAGEMLIEPVSNIRKSVRKLLARSRSPKLMPPLDAVEAMTRQCQREYLAWLAGMMPNERLFRYGYDRYFNRLSKTKRPEKPRKKKGHPYPRWLEPYMFNNHPNTCECRACGGLGKYHRGP